MQSGLFEAKCFSLSKDTLISSFFPQIKMPLKDIGDFVIEKVVKSNFECTLVSKYIFALEHFTLHKKEIPLTHFLDMTTTLLINCVGIKQNLPKASAFYRAIFALFCIQKDAIKWLDL